MSDIYIYSDESGVFDSKHNDYFVFGGIICLGKENRDDVARKYINAESIVRGNKYTSDYELKATEITNREKGKLFKSLDKVYKFAVIVTQKDLNQEIFKNKRLKQDYLDHVYKVVVKKALKDLAKRKIFIAGDIENVYCYPDQHTIAINGKHDLKENLFIELKLGEFNPKLKRYFKPLIPELKDLDVKYCDSKKEILVRATDIIANKIYYLTTHNNNEAIGKLNNLFIYHMPNNKGHLSDHLVKQPPQQVSSEDRDLTIPSK